MAQTYRIRLLIGKMDTSMNPPEFLGALFSSASPDNVTVSEQECVVTFATPQTPADLGPLVRVELISNP